MGDIVYRNIILIAVCAMLAVGLAFTGLELLRYGGAPPAGGQEAAAPTKKSPTPTPSPGQGEGQPEETGPESSPEPAGEQGPEQSSAKPAPAGHPHKPLMAGA